MLKYFLCLFFISSRLFSLEKDDELKIIIVQRIQFLEFCLEDIDSDEISGESWAWFLKGQIKAYEDMYKLCE